MKIIDALKQKSDNPSDYWKMALKLYNLATSLEDKARNHLKKIIGVLPEFDNHDAEHSEMVISNIEKFLANNVEKLSTYELFLTYLSAFFHDCAMALSDWELNVLKLTEGTDKYSINDNSICHDLKTPFSFSEATAIIKEKKISLYGTFNSDVQKWLFSPDSEDELISYLASMLIEYQKYRNGFTDQLRKASNQDDFECLNTSIRTDYIRSTHHIRIESYVNNLKTLFGSSLDQDALGEKLAKDLACVCRAHGENIDYLTSLDTAAQYYGDESANLQLVAILLCLGDIIHFSFDRAPLELRTSRLFKSEYSFLQWIIKDSGANYSIKNGKISFRAYCKTPKQYFKLHDHLDRIEIEIQKYFKLQRAWGESYKSFIPNLQDNIDRIAIKYDKKKFIPKRGLGFSLNQKTIIELLMSVGLYKDKFACLRELYQNSLDACRCMISEAKSINHKATGLIQFGIERVQDGTFLYCKDNGIGMTTEIIENYLLKIGNSYYKSAEFYIRQAQWGGTFTPTSQFGIGILSCFMLGNKIEIITKTRGGEYVACVIDGPHENCYYRIIKEAEKELILESGTVVKILLTNENNDISDSGIETPNQFLLLENPHFNEYQNTDPWLKHLYHLVNNFISVIPDNINVEVVLDNGKKLRIYNKPIPLTHSDFDFTGAELELLNDLLVKCHFYHNKLNFSFIKDAIEVYEIDIESGSLRFRTTLPLPKSGATNLNLELNSYYFTEIDSRNITCVEGVSVNNYLQTDFLRHFYYQELLKSGVLNFIGENKPQLTVDRTRLISYPSDHEKKAKEISNIFIKQVSSIVSEHITNYNLPIEELELLWEFVFDKVGFADVAFINALSMTDFGDIFLPKIEQTTNEKLSLKMFLEKENLEFKDFNFSTFDTLTKKPILLKLISAETIEITDDAIKCNVKRQYGAPFIGKKHNSSDKTLLIKADIWPHKYSEFDIVSSLYPLIPESLFDALAYENEWEIDENFVLNNRFKTIYNSDNLYYGGGSPITNLFNQDPFLAYETFEVQRKPFDLFEIKQNFREPFVITAFIAPKQLTVLEKFYIEQKKEENESYYNGVTNGWSVLVTGQKSYNTVILPGKKSRDELSSALPEDFWISYHHTKFRYLNGEEMKKQR